MPKKKVAWLGHLPSHSSFRPYVTAIGQAMIAMNGLQEAFRALFWTVMGAGFIGSYSAAWYAITNDNAQRKMLLAVARLAQENGDIPDRAYDDIKWLIKEANDVSEVRNDAAHAPLVSWGAAGKTSVSPSHMGHPRAKRLANKHLLTEFRWCRDTAVVLADFCLRLDAILAGDAEPPWPDRPRLPNRGQKN